MTKLRSSHTPLSPPCTQLFFQPLDQQNGLGDFGLPEKIDLLVHKLDLELGLGVGVLVMRGRDAIDCGLAILAHHLAHHNERRGVGGLE